MKKIGWILVNEGDRKIATIGDTTYNKTAQQIADESDGAYWIETVGQHPALCTSVPENSERVTLTFEGIPLDFKSIIIE